METRRPIDRVNRGSAAGCRLDLTGFPGTWINANPHTTGIARLEVELEDGVPSVRAIAVGPDGLLDWGVAETTGVYAFGPDSTAGAGFSLRYDFGFLESLVHANLNKGLMVFSTYSRYRDGSDRPDYFIREYFSVTQSRHFRLLRSTEEAGAVPLTPALGYASATDCRFRGRPVLDPGPVLGRWLNTNPRSTGFAEVVITREGERLTVRGALKNGAGAWGEAEGIVLANIEEEDKISDVALLALFDLGFLETQMQLRFNKELLVAAQFHAIRDGSGRCDHFSRDFFYRA